MAQTLPEKLGLHPRRDDPNPLVLYHGRHCPDEIRSADALGDLAGRTVYLLDFAFGPQLLGAVAARAARLVVLDHHQSAFERLQGWHHHRAVVHFDMGQSGARLAWAFFQADQPIPSLVRCIEDRDLWKWAFADSAAFLAALDMQPREFARWAEIAAFTPAQEAQFVAQGAAMDAKFQQLCADIAAGAQPVRFNGILGLMVNCPSAFHSQVGDLLARQSGSYALLWHASSENPGSEVKVGLRSRTGFNCIALAERFGGGGHAQACGFKMDKAHLAQLLAGELLAP